MNIYKTKMRVSVLTTLAAACLIAFTAASSARPLSMKHEAVAGKPNYKFKNKISREVLENYLDRSITMQRMLTGEGNFEDNLRMIGNIKAKFIGRAVCQWGEEARLMENFAREKELATRVHAQDPEIILQACIFEIVTPQIDQIVIPDWAFQGLGMPVEKRTFRYADMLYPDGRFKGHWGSGPREGSVPDVSRPETKLMFYFLAASYIDAGIEGLHFGQVELMNKNDKNLDHYAQILGLIRQYATKHARRGMVICDSHVPSGGFVKDGNLLMDVHAFPLRIKETPGPEGEEKAILEVGHTDALYTRSKGGITPSGWKCEHLPYLVEFDNFGSTPTPGKPTGGIWVYGYDEISWFAKQSDAYRREFLRYAYNWLVNSDPNGFLEMPGSRQTVRSIGKRWYDVNNKSEAVPNGSGDEDTIRDIWANGRTSKR